MDSNRRTSSDSTGRPALPAASLSLTRRRLLGGVAAAWAVGAVRTVFPAPEGPSVEIVHWANGHMMNTNLLPSFAQQYNQAGYRTASGMRIVVKPVTVNSGDMLRTLSARISQNSALGANLPEPTIITPAADHWLGRLNYAAGRSVVDPGKSQTLAQTWVGIATFREMAEVLGWPRRELGISDFVSLASDPQGWKAYRGAKIEWGQKPLMSFTDPDSSSTGCSMLFALYCIAAGKSPEQLTAADAASPAVVDYVKRFQSAVDHYAFDTLNLNSKIYGGPRFGHFFFVGETNLVQLYQGKLAVTVGAESKPQPLTRDMVFIYPKEGAIAHNHSASVLQAPWVTAEQAEAAQSWIAYLREDAQQSAFMGEGFRPATTVAYVPPVGSRFVPDLAKPTARLNPDTIAPQVAEQIVGSWGDVRKPGVLMFVVDTSGSMAGVKLDQAKQGIKLALDGMPSHNRVGLITFSDRIQTRIPIANLAENGYPISEAIDRVQASGGTALYDALCLAVTMADEAPGDENAIRGVAVATDGRANQGQACLSDVVELMATNEKRVPSYCGLQASPDPIDEDGKTVRKSELTGTGLAIMTRHPVHIFFVGVGKDPASIAQDVDMDVGRVLAEGTHGSFQGVVERDLAALLEKFGKYF